MNELPQSVDAERSVLGAMLLNQNAIPPAVDILGHNAESNFSQRQHAHIFRAILRLYAIGTPVDIVTLAEALVEGGGLDEAGGVSYIAELTDATPTSANVEYYANIVRSTALRRGLIMTCQRLISESYSQESDISDVVKTCQGELDSLIETQSGKRIETVGEVTPRILEEIQSRRNKEFVLGVNTGWKHFDSIMEGLKPGSFNCVAARPSVGKTAWANNVAYNMASAGHPVLFFSMEMTPESIVKRLFSIDQNTSFSVLCGDFLEKKQFEKIQGAAHTMSQLPFSIDPTPKIDLFTFRSRVRRWYSRLPKDSPRPVVFMDYLQIAKMAYGRKDMSRHEAIAEYAEEIKCIAAELSIPIVVLAQLGRAAENIHAEELYFCMSQIEHCGAIEQIADSITILSRKLPGDLEQWGKSIGLRTWQLINSHIVKNREGAIGKCHMFFEKKTQAMTPLVDYENQISKQLQLPGADEDPLGE